MPKDEAWGGVNSNFWGTERDLPNMCHEASMMAPNFFFNKIKVFVSGP